MRDWLGIFLCLAMFGSCSCIVVQSVEDRQRCEPVCAPYAYAKVTAHGACVCNLNQLVKGE